MWSRREGGGRGKVVEEREKINKRIAEKAEVMEEKRQADEAERAQIKSREAQTINKRISSSEAALRVRDHLGQGSAHVSEGRRRLSKQLLRSRLLQQLSRPEGLMRELLREAAASAGTASGSSAVERAD